MTETIEAPPEPRLAPTDRPSRRPSRFVLLVLGAVIVGFGLRVAIGLTDDAASTDETAYQRSGESLVQGEGFERDGEPELHFPPLMPMMLGLTGRVFADPHTGTVVLTVVSGTALIVPLALLGRRVAGPWAGVSTAWVAALAPGLATMPQIRGTGSEAEYTLFVVAALWFVVAAADRQGRARHQRIAAAGLLVGLAYLTRPEGLFMALPLGVAVIAIALRERGQRRPARDVAQLAGVFVAPIILCVVPYAAYLHNHTGQWQLTAKTQDASIEAWHAVARSDREERNEILYALDESGLRFSAEYSSLPTLAREDPSGYLAIIGTNAENLYETALDRTLLSLPVWLVAALGAWRHRRSKVVALILGVGALPVATSLAFFVQQRYLLVTIALATVLVGIAVASVAPRLRHALAISVVSLVAVQAVLTFRGDVAGWWHPVEQTEQRRAGEWIAAHTDADDRIMTRSMIVSFYAERPTVAIPHASLDEIVRFARHYGAQFLVADWYTVERLIPALELLRDNDELAGLRLVHEVSAEGRTARIFALEPAPPPSTEPPPALGFTGDGLS